MCLGSEIEPHVCAYRLSSKRRETWLDGSYYRPTSNPYYRPTSNPYYRPTSNPDLDPSSECNPHPKTWGNIDYFLIWKATPLSLQKRLSITLGWGHSTRGDSMSSHYDVVLIISLYGRWLDVIEDDQQSDGAVTNFVPSLGSGDGAPNWQSAYPSIIWGNPYLLISASEAIPHTDCNPVADGRDVYLYGRRDTCP